MSDTAEPVKPAPCQLCEAAKAELEATREALRAIARFIPLSSLTYSGWTLDRCGLLVKEAFEAERRRRHND